MVTQETCFKEHARLARTVLGAASGSAEVVWCATGIKQERLNDVLKQKDLFLNYELDQIQKRWPWMMAHKFKMAANLAERKLG